MKGMAQKHEMSITEKPSREGRAHGEIKDSTRVNTPITRMGGTTTVHFSTCKLLLLFYDHTLPNCYTSPPLLGSPFYGLAANVYVHYAYSF